MRLVIDASLAVRWTLTDADAGALTRHDLVAPPLLISEATSTLAELVYRRELALETARVALSRLVELPIRLERPASLALRAFEIAQELGWAKTYDAEYLAMAVLLDIPLVTIDARLARGGRGVARVIGPTEIA